MNSSIKRLYAFMLISAYLLLLDPKIVRGAEELGVDPPNVLVIYSADNGEMDEHQRMLDMLLGHFTHKIKFVSSFDVKEDDLHDVDYLFYYGQKKEVLPSKMLEIIPMYEGIMVAIGHNTNQLGERYSFMNQSSTDIVIDQTVLLNQRDKQLSFSPQYMIDTNIVEESQSEMIAIGKKDDKELPLFMKNGTNYYFASNHLKQPFSLMFAEMLYEIFSESELAHTDTNLGYIRLEDIHPLVDPEPMQKIADVLAERKIPYMIAVIPVYTNPETKKQYHFSDSPKLLKILKSMQANGGSIVLHGYTHQFRLSETGEGFEFWDVEHNMPIYHGPDEEIIMKSEKDFTSEYEYEQYLTAQKEYEKEYIDERLTKGIQELANYGLYPLAFEAPHYTMSQHGYEVASDYFSTYVGQIQMSDEDWKVMTTSPYMTKPEFLHGMTLLPETIGYVEPEESRAIEKMVNRARDYQFVRGGMVSGFYHPYLGVESFIELMDELEKIPKVNWIDLKQMNNWVKAEHVDIKTENNEIIVDINRFGLFNKSFDYFNFHLKKGIKVFLWCIAGIGALAIISFSIQTFYSRKRKYQTKRRESVG